jgi:hypothetical protein
MDSNLMELLKWIAPAVAAAVASYYAGRERIKVLETKGEAMSKSFDEFKGEVREAFGELRDDMKTLDRRLVDRRLHN